MYKSFSFPIQTSHVFLFNYSVCEALLCSKIDYVSCCAASLPSEELSRTANDSLLNQLHYVFRKCIQRPSLRCQLC